MIFDLTFAVSGGYMWPAPPESAKIFQQPPEIAKATFMLIYATMPPCPICELQPTAIAVNYDWKRGVYYDITNFDL